ncbi:hypothetical protein PHMEG_0005129 [Phytophthora megakarya]|uniref:Uncharacterized protein n=1 Tax=Phytophthora megakarya TaxID=4795 RepID=A0A225WTM1_9STRA|nr:hypothetical protein PHMEG_0005129 [Phytophthora megakarya]
MQTVSTIKQFVAKQRTLTRSLRAQPQDIPQISLPKRRSSAIYQPEVVNEPQRNNANAEFSSASKHDSSTAGYLKVTCSEVVLEAVQCGEYELAFRLCIVEDDLELLRRTMWMVKSPCMATLSTTARNALCTAFLSLFDNDEDEDSPDVWLLLQWLQQWAAVIRNGRRQFEQLDPRVAQALISKLQDMATATTKSSLVAAHVVFLLGI